MHKYLESFITDVGYDDLTELGQAAKPMAEKIMEVGLAPVSEYFGSEVTLHYPGLYAGQTDLVCLHNDLETIVDFKQANRPKKKEWIEDYYLQIAAYAMAHDYVYGSSRYAKELSWYARLTYITKNLGSRTTNYGPGNTNFKTIRYVSRVNL